MNHKRLFAFVLTALCAAVLLSASSAARSRRECPHASANSVPDAGNDPRLPAASGGLSLTALSAPLIPGAIFRVYSTNLITRPTFNLGIDGWGTEKSPSTGVGVAVRKVYVATGIRASFSYAEVQMARASTSDFLQLDWLTTLPVDNSKSYRAGALCYSDQNVNGRFGFYLFDSSGIFFSTLTSSVGPVVTNGSIAWPGVNVAVTLNAAGGSAPALTSATSAVGFSFDFAPNTGTADDSRLIAAYFIRSEQLPTDTFTATSYGIGTHESYYDSASDALYVVSHSYARLCKFNGTTLVRQACAATSAYPHAVLKVGSFIYVINYTGATLQKFDASLVEQVGSPYSLPGGLKGFDMATDGTDLYVGIGDGAASLYKFTVLSGTFTLLNSADLHNQGNDQPIVFQNDSLWSINTTTTTGNVKRMSAAGTLQATISTGLGLIYGLGSDGTYVYVNGERGVGKINPADNSITTYPFRQLRGGYTKLKVDASGRVWGACQVTPGIFYLNPATGDLVEMLTPAGEPKWAQPVANNQVVLGYYSMPSLDVYAPGQ